MLLLQRWDYSAGKFGVHRCASHLDLLESVHGPVNIGLAAH
jgi:hypothetical protein